MYLETGWTPVDELDSTLSLNGGDSSIDILGYDISTVKHAASHVFAMTRITLNHLVGRLEASVSDFTNSQLLVVSLLS